MLPKQYRLKNNSAYTATYKVKNSKHLSGITVFFGKLKKDDTVVTKVGFVVSKKAHKRAVKRNRLKRLMRESYRLILKDSFVSDYMSMIFVGHEKALGLNFKSTDSVIKKLLEIK